MDIIIKNEYQHINYLLYIIIKSENKDKNKLSNIIKKWFLLW